LKDSALKRTDSPLRPRFGGVVFNGAPPRAYRLRWETIESAAETGIRYDIDTRFSGEVRIDWSRIGGPPSVAETRVLSLSLAALMAQYALPSTVEGPTMSSNSDAVHRIVEMLYDIRAFCDETPVRRATMTGPSLESIPAPTVWPNARRVLVLLSGGFDSTFAALLLREAGYDVEALHVRTNRHVEVPEEVAARAIASLLGIPLHVVPIDSPDEERIGRYYSRTFGVYPFYNSVPHGRDFPLGVLAAIVARRLGCGTIAFGHEKESRRKIVPFDGRTVYRHDVESGYGADLLREFLAAAGFTVKMFSPLAGLSLYAIRAAVLRRWPEYTRSLQFCFWGRRCEKCLKCVSTYTMQRHLAVDAIPFELNPFSDHDDQDMALLAQPDRPSEMLAYGPQMHFAMRAILIDGLARPDDFWLHRFRQTGLPEVEKRLPLLEALCLRPDHPPEVPEDVRAAASRLI